MKRHLQYTEQHDSPCKLTKYHLQQAAKAFQKHRWMLQCHDRSIKHRLRYFEAIVSSTACFAAEHRPLYRKHLQKYDVQFGKLVRRIVGPPPSTDWSAQWHDILHEWNMRADHWARASGISSWSEKCMIQYWKFASYIGNIVGWVRIHDGSSRRDIMVQMNHKLAIAKTLFPMEGWADRLFRSKFRLAHRIARSPERWPAKSVSWNRLTNWESNFACKPQRKRGRPSTRWDDILTNFSSEFFHNDNWWHVAREASSWFTSEGFCVQFCRAHFGL